MTWRVTALVLAVGLVAGACGTADEVSDPPAEVDGEAVAGTGAGGDEAGSPEGADSDAIKLGDISSYSGADVFPEPAQMARLVFKRYNEQGGLDGRPIELVSVDDQDTAPGAATGARRLLEEEQVVGFCCGGSIVDCTTNAGYYAEHGVEAVPAAAACVEAATVHPVNAGPFLPSLHLLDFLHHDLGHDELCFTGYNVPINEAFQTQIRPQWEADSGLTLTSVVPEPGDDLTPVVTHLVESGCQAVLAAFTELNYQSFFAVVDAQGAAREIDFAMLTSGYSLSLLDSAGALLEGIYAGSEFEPFTGDPAAHSAEAADFVALSESVGVLPTSFGEAGYLAANIMIEVLESIEGEITFESVQAAIRSIHYETELLGQPFVATGYVDGSQPNQTSQVLQVQGTDFVPVGAGWRAFPLGSSGR